MNPTGSPREKEHIDLIFAELSTIITIDIIEHDLVISRINYPTVFCFSSEAGIADAISSF